MKLSLLIKNVLGFSLCSTNSVTFRYLIPDFFIFSEQAIQALSTIVYIYFILSHNTARESNLLIFLIFLQSSHLSPSICLYELIIYTNGRVLRGPLYTRHLYCTTTIAFFHSGLPTL